MDFKHSLFYWAAYASHGFADVQLDDGLLRRIRSQIKALQQKPDTATGPNKDMMVRIVLDRTREAYDRLGHRERKL